MDPVPWPTFADAHAEWDEANVILVGVPFDITASFRTGAKFAPNAIRDTSWNLESYVFRHNISFSDIGVHDAGNLDVTPHIATMLNAVCRTATGIFESSAFPLFVGGDHSITPGIVAAAHDAYGDELGVITIDAHLDFRDEYLGEKNSHACTTRRIADIVGAENVIPLGVRSCSAEEVDDARDAGLYSVSAFTIREQGIDAVLADVRERLNKKYLYLSFDIDGLDPAYAPATGTPEAFGLTDYDALRIFDAVADRLIGFDLVEVCPPYDKGNTAALAALLIRDIACAVHLKRHV